jgi:transposase
MVYGPMSILPSETAQLAKTVFNPEDPYLYLGNHITRILEGLSINKLEVNPNEKNRSMLLLAVITIMQYNEGFNDTQAVEAVSVRLDWKYALHLPLHYIYITPESLCEFRSHVRRNLDAKEVFQEILRRLVCENFLMGKARQLDSANQVISELCSLNRLMMLSSSFYSLLESVAACKPDWLRSIALPHWYERYFRMSDQAFQNMTVEMVQPQASAVGKDCVYLLEAVEQAGVTCPACIQECQNLWRDWRRQFEEINDEIYWNPGVCALCEPADTIQENNGNGLASYM